MAYANSGFVQLRRGLAEHVRTGRLSFLEASLYVFILMDTHPATGVCYGSAGLFAAVYGISTRTCRDVLEKLEQKGYLRRFPTRGKHGSYPILINKFLCSDGAMKGKYVNAVKSTSCENVYYESCDESVDDDVNERVNDGAASKRIENREQRQEQELTLSSPAETPKRVRLQDFPETWNRLCGRLPRVELFSESRKKQVTTRIRQGITVARFEQAVLCCVQKPFLRGENEGGWTATFDWLVKNDKNIEKAITQPYGSNIDSKVLKNGRIPNGKTKSNMVVLAESLARGKRESPADENGLFSASEPGGGNPRTLHGLLAPAGPESVPGGDGEPGGKRETGG